VPDAENPRVEKPPETNLRPAAPEPKGPHFKPEELRTSGHGRAEGAAPPTDAHEITVTPLGPGATTSELEFGPRRARHAHPRRGGLAGSAIRGSRRAGRAARLWTERPAGRLVLPSLLILLLVGATGTAGAYLIPATADPSEPPAVAGDAPDPSATRGVPVPEQGGEPTGLPTTQPTGGVAAPGREASKLAGWALPLASRLQIPQPALEAYGYAQLVMERLQPSCRLSWTTLAGIGKVESNHGRSGGATLTADGQAYPPIIGAPLDGQGGRKLVADTDGGMLDNDSTYDRAVGPMQFIPSTWQNFAEDADSDGTRNPHDIDDAALAAAKYLCSNGRDMGSTGWRDGILSYNNVGSYADLVYETANGYGQQARNAG
jgi:hypothetical protein